MTLAPRIQSLSALESPALLNQAETFEDEDEKSGPL